MARRHRRTDTTGRERCLDDGRGDVAWWVREIPAGMLWSLYR